MDFDDYEALPTGKMSVHMSAGAVAGVMEHVVMYPVDSVKTRMQAVDPSPRAAVNSVSEGFSKIISTEGYCRLLRGVSPVIVGAAPAHALYFSAYECLKNRQTSSHPFLNHATNASAGCVATMLHDGIMVPADVIKQRMQMFGSPYKSTFNCIQSLYKGEGIRAFFRSYPTQMTMNLPNHGILIVTYEKMQKALNPSGQYNPLVHCTAGAVAGAIGAAVTNPLDVCKTLLNTQESSVITKLNTPQVRGMRAAAKTIYDLQGLKGFLRGLNARMLYQMPSTAIAWSIYEMFKHLLNNKGPPGNSGQEAVKDGVLPPPTPKGGHTIFLDRPKPPQDDPKGWLAMGGSIAASSVDS